MHVGGFRAAGAEVVGLCGANLAKTRTIADREGVPLATDDVTALCREVELVVVASPDRHHASHLAAALAARRSVLSEKPLVRTEAEAERTLLLAAGSGATCAVNFPCRALPTFGAVRTWLERNPPLRHLSVTVRNGFARLQQRSTDWLGESGDFGGVSHPLDAALWLARSPPRWVHATLQGKPAQTVTLQLGLGDGARITLQHLAVQEPGIWGEWTLAGDDWDLRFSAGYLPARGGWVLGEVTAYRGAPETIHPAVWPAEGKPEPWAAAHVVTARWFLDAVGGAPPPWLASFEDGARVQRVLQRAIESEEGGGRVFLSAPGSAATG
jgi:predicted dehydrogenase